MNLLAIVGLSITAVALGVGLAILVNFWLELVAKPSDQAGAYHAKSLWICLPNFYLFLSWTAFIAAVNRNAIQESHISDFIWMLFNHIPGLALSVLPISIFGLVISHLNPPLSSKSHGSHDHHLEHSFLSILYAPLCVGAFILFAIWPRFLDAIFGWARSIAAMHF